MHDDDNDDNDDDDDRLFFPGQWRFSQCFGDKGEPVEVSEGINVGTNIWDVGDLISALAFDRSGSFLASGDRAGRVVLFERNAEDGQSAGEYRFYTEFQSHEAEFDYLKSLEINERINRIEWWSTPPQQDALFLLSTNDKTIKLWKVRERQVQMVLEKTANPLALSAGLLKLPPSGRSGEVVVAAAPRRVYGNAHAYHIHSVSACCDGETFLSADDLRVNLWHVEHPTEHHCVLDIKPASIEDLTEVITSAKFHPTQCNLLAFSSSKGNVRLCDLRDSAVIDGKYALTLSQPTLPASQGSEFFGEIISSISDLSFAAQAPHLLAARDFMTVKLWDLRNDALPLCTLPVHDYVRPKLCDLYESDGIFDKFNVVLNPTGQFVVTGSYGNRVRILPTTCAAAGSEKEGEAFLETLTADKSILTTTHPHSNSISPSGSRTNLMLKGAIGKRTSLRHQAREVDSDAVDYDKRVLLAALSPHNQGDCIAVAASANLFLFSSSPSASSSPSSASASSVSSSSWANQLATDRNGSRRR